MSTHLPQLTQFIENLPFASLPKERREVLQKIASYLQSKKEKGEEINLNFICTHNSRRSQLCQVWAATAISYFGLQDSYVYSGGTETTAFHPNAVQALEDVGFPVTKEGPAENPVYKIHYSEQADPIDCFSKRYHEALPDSRPFIAILTCADAEANCPFIPEAEVRFSLTYEDPKAADGTSQQTQVYRERNRQIGTEIFYLFSKLNLYGIQQKTQLS